MSARLRELLYGQRDLSEAWGVALSLPTTLIYFSTLGGAKTMTELSLEGKPHFLSHLYLS